jgi:hypothetical protein
MAGDGQMLTRLPHAGSAADVPVAVVTGLPLRNLLLAWPFRGAVVLEPFADADPAMRGNNSALLCRLFSGVHFLLGSRRKKLRTCRVSRKYR